MSADNLEERHLDILGVRTRYHDVGEGEPLLLLHGAGPGASGLSNYRRNIEALAAGHRVLILDLPGFGGTDNKLPEGGLFAAMGVFVRAFLEALGIRRVSVIGNSMGGGIALEVALRAPGLVRCMVLMGGAGSLPTFTAMPTEGLQRMFGFYSGEGPTMQKLRAVLSLLVFDQSTITDALLEERFEAATRPDVVAEYIITKRPIEPLWREDLASLSHPTLLIWGREDRVIPLDASFLLLKQIPNASLHVIPRCGHWVQWEKADAFNALVLEFLSRN
ncbi:MAG: alpha/beta fold hydrolase [Caulobacterales bacterium]